MLATATFVHFCWLCTWLWCGGCFLCVLFFHIMLRVCVFFGSILKCTKLFKTHHLSVCSHLNWILCHWLKWKRNNYLKIVYRMCRSGHSRAHFFVHRIFPSIWKCNWMAQSVANWWKDMDNGQCWFNRPLEAHSMCVAWAFVHSLTRLFATVRFLYSASGLAGWRDHSFIRFIRSFRINIAVNLTLSTRTSNGTKYI